MFLDKPLFDAQKLPPSLWGPNNIWSDTMAKIKKKVYEHTGLYFETCVCIHYPNGSSGVDYHSDSIAFGDTTVIASISLGAERTFHLREKATMQVHEMVLEHGSLLVMGAGCQENYEHALPEVKDCDVPRVNLTFRRFGFGR